MTGGPPLSAIAGPRSRDGDAGARIADDIRRGIIDGSRPPGTRVRQEDLAARYGASRVPVREAIRQLEYEGLLTVVPNAGAWVSTMTLAECEEIYRMRERLEPLLLSYSAPHLSDEAVTELAALADRISNTGHDTEAFLALDATFHHASYTAADTAHLSDLVLRLWNMTAPYRRSYVASWTSDARRIAHEEHHLIVAALRDHDTAEAERVLAAHIRRTRRQLARTPEIFADRFGPR